MAEETQVTAPAPEPAAPAAPAQAAPAPAAAPEAGPTRMLRMVLFGRGLVNEPHAVNKRVGDLIAEKQQVGELKTDQGVVEMKINGRNISPDTLIRDLPDGVISFTYRLKQG